VPERVFQLDQWATVSPAAGWVIEAGRFLGGTGADLLAYLPGNGSLWVGGNDDDHFTFTQPWATLSPAAGWQLTVGDFTGNGLADVAAYHPGNGTVWVGENRGSTFAFSLWATLSPASGWRIGPGFFTMKAKADLLAHHVDSGTLWVGTNTGSAFTFMGTWAAVDPAGDWQFATGDFVGNGRTDVVGYNAVDGSVWVGENGGSSFDLSQWATLNPAAGWHIDSGFFTGRGKSDLFAHHSGGGTLWVGENQGSSFLFGDTPSAVATGEGWQFVTASVNGDVWDDVVGYSPLDGGVVVGASSLRPIEGYCWPLSAAPGGVISFHLSGEGAAVADFQRHLSTTAEVDSLPVGSREFTALRQPVPDEPWRVGCGWTPTFDLTIPADWVSGIYSAHCTDSADTSCDITFIVKPAPADRSGIAVLANVNTWLAYNGWGGQSKYTGLARTSFLRPMPGAAPEGDLHLTRGELWILGWLESQGHQPDVYTDVDFHDRGCDPAQYPCLVFGTHPEYWTREMYDNLAAYLDAGGSVAYLGGNGVFEIGEPDNGGTEMVFRLGVEGGPRELALFRTQGKPELALLGVATERCGVGGSPFLVRAADHDLFAGTGVADGDVVGDSGLNTGAGNGKASGWEVDTTRGPGATGIPAPGCLLDPAPVTPSVLPDGLVVLAEGAPDGVGPGAEMTYYDHPGGGFVFSAGSLTFGGSLVVDPVLSALVSNVLNRAGVGADDVPPVGIEPTLGPF
jgi:hypothetical protein